MACPNLDEVVWYVENSGLTTHEVGQKKPNACGIYDMHGNVEEWCRDWYGEYPNENLKDPIGAYSGSYRVSRGGGWDNGADEYEVRRCRSAYRHNGFNPDKGDYLVGFRVALVPVE